MRLLADKRTAAQLKALRAKLDEDELALTDAEPAVGAGHSFHHLVIEYAGNQTVAVLVAMLDRIIDLATLTLVASSSPSATSKAFRQGQDAHRQLVDLVEARDAAGAEQMWANHLSKTAEYVTRGAGARKVLDLFG